MSDAIVGEEWKPVPINPNYEGRSQGRVRSLTRIVRCVRHGHEGTRVHKGRILKQIHNKGYLVVKMGAANQAYGVHQVVAMAFHGLPPEGYVVDHVDTNKHNNRPENLEYVTPGENTRRQWVKGLLPSGNRATPDNAVAPCVAFGG